MFLLLTLVEAQARYLIKILNRKMMHKIENRLVIL